MARQILLDTREVNDGNKLTGGRLHIDRAVENAKNAPANPFANERAAAYRRALQKIL